MANVSDLHHVIANEVQDLVWIPHQEFDSDIRLLGWISAVGSVAQLRDCRTNARHDIAGSGWRAFVKIFENALAISKWVRSVSDPHTPWRLSASATTSSETNSPRSASANPSRTAL